MHHPLTKTIPFVLPKDNTVTLSHPERYLKTRLVSYSRKTAAQHVFLSLTEAKPSKDKAALSAFFRPRANTEGRSVLHGCQVSAEDRASDLAPPRPRIPDSRYPPALASLSMHPTAIICISADRTYARSAKGGQILLSNSGMRYRAKGGMDGRKPIVFEREKK